MENQYHIYLVLVALISVQSSLSSQTKTYTLAKIKSGMIELNGKGDHTIWTKATKLNDFSYPWNQGTPPPMTFQGLHDKDWIYGLYVVHDTKKINLYTDKNTKHDVLKSDRVEIFMRQDANMDPYYGMEMDPLGRNYDYVARHYRNSDNTWSWPKDDIQLKTNMTPEGYTLEFALSKKSLKKLGLLKRNKIEAGLFRGECVELKDGNAEFKWISWVTPASKTPDFHIPSSFGVLKLGK